jgi:hypothetical protein
MAPLALGSNCRPSLSQCTRDPWLAGTPRPPRGHRSMARPGPAAAFIRWVRCSNATVASIWTTIEQQQACAIPRYPHPRCVKCGDYQISGLTESKLSQIVRTGPLRGAMIADVLTGDHGNKGRATARPPFSVPGGQRSTRAAGRWRPRRCSRRELGDRRGQRETARSHLNEIAPTLMMPGLWHGAARGVGAGGRHRPTNSQVEIWFPLEPIKITKLVR